MKLSFLSKNSSAFFVFIFLSSIISIREKLREMAFEPLDNFQEEKVSPRAVLKSVDY